MKKYTYAARNCSGDLLKGVIHGTEPEECLRQLRINRLYPIKLRRVFWDQERFLNGSKAIKYAEMAVFCKQFTALLQAGIAIPQALRLLNEQKDSAILYKLIQDLIKGLEQGQSLYQGVVKYERYLPNFFAPLIRAGEMTNSLDLVLEDLAIYYQQVDQFQKQIGQLLIYPIILLISTFGVMCFLFLKIIPGFQDIYLNFDTEMPILTNCLLTISHNISLNFKKYLGGLVICILFLSYFIKALSNNHWFLLLQYRIPIWGRLQRIRLTGRLSRTLSLLLENGLEVLQAIELARGSAGRIVDYYLNQISMQLRQGIGLTGAMKMTRFFPKIFLEMVSVGEESGSLGKMLDRGAEIYEKEFQTRVEGLIKIFEPLLLMIIAIVVGLIVFAIMLPMFDLIKLF